MTNKYNGGAKIERNGQCVPISQNTQDENNSEYLQFVPYPKPCLLFRYCTTGEGEALCRITTVQLL